MKAAYLQGYIWKAEGALFGGRKGLGQVDVMQITSLADEEGPNTVATRSLGDQNLLLVDEGHRGMSGKDEGVWFNRRSMLCEKGSRLSTPLLSNRPSRCGQLGFREQLCQKHPL